MARVVGTYNMSFASDMGKLIGSEAMFLKTNRSGDPRKFWKNALANLRHFIKDHNPIAVGLQEMNLVEKGDIGTAAVRNMLKGRFGDRYGIVSNEVSFKFGKPALSVIWERKTLGELVNAVIYDNIEENWNPNWEKVSRTAQAGRPLLLVETEHAILVNIHGSQNPPAGRNMHEFRQFTEINVKDLAQNIINDYQGDSKKLVFLMGDFNDRYDAITEIPTKYGKLTYNGYAPISCCHNWDSSCTDSRYYTEGFDAGYGTCNVPDPAPEAMGEEGWISNYRYRGDKVFGQYPDGTPSLFVYPSPHSARKHTSTSSDHELVYGMFNLPKQGGRCNDSRKKKSRINYY